MGSTLSVYYYYLWSIICLERVGLMKYRVYVYKSERNVPFLF